jgi:DNA-binding protein HU-beta
VAVEAHVFRVWRRVSGSPPRSVKAASSNNRQRIPRGGSFVNKSELIEHIARQADISKAAATRALEAVIGGVKTTLKKGGSVSIVGFGTFAVTKRAARVGRNPRTNEPIKIKSAKVPKFRPGKGLKDAVN